MSKEMLELATRLEKHATQNPWGTFFEHIPRDMIAAAAALRASAVAEPVAWCQPMDCGKHTPRKFLLYFEDADRGIEVFDDEDEARAAFERADTAWNCYLFGALPKAVAHPAPAAPVPASVRGALEPFAKIAPLVEFTDLRDGEVVHRQVDKDGKRHELTKADFRRAASALASLPAPEAAPTREEIISIVEDECFLNHFSPVEKTKSQKTLWRVGHNIRERILALKAAPAK